MDTTTAPLIPVTMPVIERKTNNYPDPSTRLGQAWQAAWDALSAKPGEFQDGTLVAEQAAQSTGLKPVTMIALMTRAATAGILERDHRSVDSGRGFRMRTHYRIPQA